MLVLIAMLSVVLVATVAFSVDVAYMQLTKTQMRAATDAASRAGSGAILRGMTQVQARDLAKQVAQQNLVAGQPLMLSDGDIVFGKATPQNDGTYAFLSGGNPTDSVRINSRRTSDSLSGTVPLLFGRALGVDSFAPTDTATSTLSALDIVLVLDRSSSMKLDLSTTAEMMSTGDARFLLPPDSVNSRWAALQTAVSAFITAMQSTRPNDKLALVTFGSNYTAGGVTNLESSLDVQLSTTYATTLTATQAYGTRVFNGATYTASGMDAARTELTSSGRTRSFAKKVIIFLTDGATTGGRSVTSAATDAKNAGITIHTITFGAVFNQTDMINTASITGGKYYQAPTPADLPNIFRTIVSSFPVFMTE